MSHKTDRKKSNLASDRDYMSLCDAFKNIYEEQKKKLTEALDDRGKMKKQLEQAEEDLDAYKQKYSEARSTIAMAMARIAGLLEDEDGDAVEDYDYYLHKQCERLGVGVHDEKEHSGDEYEPEEEEEEEESEMETENSQHETDEEISDDSELDEKKID